MSHEPKPERAGSDAALLIEAIAASRDREAFTRLFEHFAPRVKSLMLRSGATSGQAEELAQETLLTVWRKERPFARCVVSATDIRSHELYGLLIRLA